MSPPFLTTERLVFRRPEEADREFVRRILSDQTLTHRPDALPAKDEVSHLVDWIYDQWKERPFGPAVIELRETEERIGVGGLKYIDIDGTEYVDLGMMFLKEYQQKGLGYEAGEALLHIAFEKFNYDIVTANTTNDNLGALHLLEMWGFEQVGQVSFDRYGVKRNDVQLWQLTRQRWEKTLHTRE